MQEKIYNALQSLPELKGCNIQKAYTNKIKVDSEWIFVWISIWESATTNRIQIESIEIIPEKQRQGIFTAILKCLYEICNKIIIKNVLSSSMEHFCEKNSFQKLNGTILSDYEVCFFQKI